MHLAKSHKQVWNFHKHRVETLSKSQLADIQVPCQLCGSGSKDPKSHVVACPVIFQSILLALVPLMAHEAEISFFKHLLPVGSQLNLTPTLVKPAVTQEPTTTSNKRARMEQTRGPKGRGRGYKHGAGRDPQETRDQRRDRDLQQLVEATARLTLKLADAQQVLLQDCGFTWFVSTEPGGILPTMFGVSAEWKKLKESSGGWAYKQWDPTKKELVDTKEAPLTLTALETIVKEIQTDIREPGNLHKFQASQPLSEDMEMMAEHREVCFTIQVSVRASVERLYRNLRKLCDNMVLKLLRSRLRQERRHRQGAAKYLDGLLRRQPCA